MTCRSRRPLTSAAELTVAGQRWVLDTSAAAGLSLPWFERASSALLLGGLMTAVCVGLFVRSLGARGRLANRLVAERTAELSAVNAQLADSNAQLAEANRAKDAFLASVSHELRTPCPERDATTRGSSPPSNATSDAWTHSSRTCSP